MWGVDLFHVDLSKQIYNSADLFVLDPLFCLFVCFCETGDVTRGLVHANQKLYHCIMCLAPLQRGFLGQCLNVHKMCEVTEIRECRSNRKHENKHCKNLENIHISAQFFVAITESHRLGNCQSWEI